MAKKEKELLTNTKDVLDKQPKKPVMIPVTESNEPFMVVINGVIYSIPRGEMVEVPESVFNVVQESLTKTISTKRDIKVSQLD